MRLQLVLICLALTVASCESSDDHQVARPDVTPTESYSPRPPDAGYLVHPHTDAVLSIHPGTVSSGEIVSVRFAPPRDHIWGADAVLLMQQGSRWKRVAFLSTWKGKRNIRTVWPQPNLGFPSIGFYGTETWRWRVPTRLEPGTYAIEKDAIEDSSEALEDRIDEWNARFEVR